MTQLDIVFVNWNSGEQLHDCLKTIKTAATNVELGRVVIVDNASTDNSLDGLLELDLPLTIIRNATNRGFGAACNQGVADSQASLILFLNPDTCLFADSLTVPIRYLEDPRHHDVGICGIQLTDGAGKVLRNCGRAPTTSVLLTRALGLDKFWPSRFHGTFMSDWDHAGTRDVDEVTGAFLMARTSLLKQLKGFDERFFVYCEDSDLCARTHLAGWRIVYLTEAQAYHRGGGTSESVKATRLYYSLTSRLQLAGKHLSLPGAWAFALVTLFVEPCVRLARAVARLSFAEFLDTLKGYARIWGGAPFVLATWRNPGTQPGAAHRRLVADEQRSTVAIHEVSQ